MSPPPRVDAVHTGRGPLHYTWEGIEAMQGREIVLNLDQSNASLWAQARYSASVFVLLDQFRATDQQARLASLVALALWAYQTLDGDDEFNWNVAYLACGQVQAGAEGAPVACTVPVGRDPSTPLEAWANVVDGVASFWDHVATHAGLLQAFLAGRGDVLTGRIAAPWGALLTQAEAVATLRRVLGYLGGNAPPASVPVGDAVVTSGASSGPTPGASTDGGGGVGPVVGGGGYASAPARSGGGGGVLVLAALVVAALAAGGKGGRSGKA